MPAITLPISQKIAFYTVYDYTQLYKLSAVNCNAATLIMYHVEEIYTAFACIFIEGNTLSWTV